MQTIELYPREFFEYFDDICKIPRGSGNELGMVEYLRKFAEGHGLEFYTDEHRNVLITKSATEGYETCPVVALQGHTDMVCQKTSDSTHDFKNDPIEWYTDGEYIKAKDTSLGADDGAAVCMMLCMLASSDIPHPKLHCLFTAEEETGLFGAHGFDYSKIKDSVYMVNIDGEEEYEVLCSCAGGVRLHLNKEHAFESEAECIKISLDGLCGGHSGADIHRYRINANVALSRLLKKISENCDIALSEFVGGTVDNAISPRAYCIISGVDQASASETCSKVDATLRALIDEYGNTEDNGFYFNVTKAGRCKVINSSNTLAFINTMLKLEHGVLAMSEDIEGLVKTSANIGVVDFKNGLCDIHISIRSSVEAEKNALCDYNASVGEKYGFTPERGQAYPGWDFKKESVLRQLYAEAFKKTHGGKTAKINAIHAGLECGIISGHLPELDIIAIGPEMSGVHSPAEKLEIASVGRIYDTIVELLRSLRD